VGPQLKSGTGARGRNPELPGKGLIASPRVRNVAAVIGGIVFGGLINSLVIALGPHLVPPPPGVDVSNPESLARGIHLFQPKHFVVPFVAHAAGTFAGALVAYLTAATHKARFAYAIGAVFLLGGVAASFLVPAPRWFVALDLLAAYLPMAWLATRFANPGR
jgi:hypothetical protein